MDDELSGDCHVCMSANSIPKYDIHLLYFTLIIINIMCLFIYLVKNILLSAVECMIPPR